YLFLGILIALAGLGFYDTRLSVFGGLAALLYFPLKAARERITYPRIGYVEFTPPAGFGRGILTFLIIAVVTLSLIAFVGNGRFQSIMPIAIGIVFSLSIFFGSSMNGVRVRDWLVIALMIAGSVLVVFAFDDWHLGTAVQFWIISLLLLVMGTADLIRFLRKYPVRAQSPGEQNG
ncbi:MAG: hypothetical protein GY943_16645, partial [Chloroflexi bacterium]|nr:hypothetical protein [Chloroflexota bacterium]